MPEVLNLKETPRLPETAPYAKKSTDAIEHLVNNTKNMALTDNNVLDSLFKARHIVAAGITDNGYHKLEELFNIQSPLYTILDNERANHYQDFIDNLNKDEADQISVLNPSDCIARSKAVCSDLQSKSVFYKPDPESVATLYLLNKRAEELCNDPNTPKDDKDNLQRLLSPLGQANSALSNYDLISRNINKQTALKSTMMEICKSNPSNKAVIQAPVEPDTLGHK